MTDTKPKILLTLILNNDNEADMLKRMLSSFMPYCDGVVANITGLTGTNKKLRQLLDSYNGIYIVTTPVTHPDQYLPTSDGKWLFGNFAAARNHVFDLADKQKGYDFYIWADVDDILVKGEELPLIAQQAKKSDVDAVYFTYWYSVALNKQGQIVDVAIDHLRERLLKPRMFKWVSRLHEVCVPKDLNYTPKQSIYDFNPKEGRSCVWAHLTTEERVSNTLHRNSIILDVQIREEERKDPRTILYLAKTYFDMHKPDKYVLAEQLFYEYIPMSGWAEERGSAWKYLGDIKTLRGDHRGAIDCYYNAVKEYPQTHMPYVLLAREYDELGLTKEADHWLDVVLKMEAPKTSTTIGNPMDLKLMAASLKYNRAIKTGQIDDAIYWMKVRNQILQKEDDGIIKTLEEVKLLNQAAGWTWNLAKWLKEHGHATKVKYLLESLPNELGREQFAHIIANDVKEPRVWGDKEICYYANFGGEFFEKFSGKSAVTGIGGSETAVIRLSEEWTKLGYKVTVYCDPREEAGEFNGVTYRPWFECNWNDTFSTLILWRSPHLLDRNIKAKRIFVDLHDVASQLDWTKERMDKVTKVFFKSNYHRKMIPKLPDSKVQIISNGI